MSAHAESHHAPVFDVDVYDDDFIRDPYPHYASMRALGPVVWLPRHDVFAAVSYDAVSQALRDPGTFISGRGLSLSEPVNKLLLGNTLNSDSPVHEARRAVAGGPLLPGALTGIEPRIRAACARLTSVLVEKRSFDAVADLAQYLPITIVAELVGLRHANAGQMLKWASATFNLFGAFNARSAASLDELKGLRVYLDNYGRPDQLDPDGWAARIFKVGPERGFSIEDCAQLMRDYINPSLDTTISATGQAIWYFASDPDQWDILREDPSLIPNAIEEVVRLGSPIRSFSRYVARDTELGGVRLPEGARLLIFYASANRDEHRFPEPDRFDVRRKTTGHVGFGQGIHMCLGMHLARLEMKCLIESLAPVVRRFELAGEPEIAMNNTIRAFSRLPVRIEVAHQGTSAGIPRPAARIASGTASAGWLDVVIADRRVEAEDIVSLELRATEGNELPPFTAGAHIDVRIRSGLVRQYSLSNAPGERHRYRLGILREPNSRGGSAAVHDAMKTGSRLRISAPRNNFPLDEEAPHTVLLAGGIGITPLLSMAHRLRALDREFTLHYCTRSRAKYAFTDELAAFGAHVRHHCDDGPVGQRLDIDRVLADAPAGAKLYTCGPNGFMGHVVAAASRAGWPPSRIHLEHFGQEIDTDGDPFTVEAVRSGITVEVNPGQTILAALAAAGLQVETSCQSGVCGTCLTPVIEGRPDHRDLFLTDLEKAANRTMTICCSRSTSSRLVLDI